MGNSPHSGRCCVEDRYEDVEVTTRKNALENSFVGHGTDSATCATPSTEAGSLSSQCVASNRHIFLNMDVNKTVIMTDSTTGKSAEAVVNEELSCATWGVEVEGQWRLLSLMPSPTRPRGPNGEKVFNYDEWVSKAFPKGDQKDLRRTLKWSFTSPGQPGAQLASLAARLRKELVMPDGSEMRLIPAFLELLIHLKRTGRSFTVCFRTFGADMHHVAAELTAFCEGRHPLFPGVIMDGSDGQVDYRLTVPDPEKCGTFYRCDDEVALIMGTLEQPGEGTYKDVQDHSLGFFRRFPRVRFFQGVDTVKNALYSRCIRGGSFGLRDHYGYWKSKGQTSEAGKVFYFDLCRDSTCHSVFFDDNVDADDFKAICPINTQHPNSRCSIVALSQSHICKAEPLRAIQDRYYFVQQLQRLEAGYERRLLARERLAKATLVVRAAVRWRAASARSRGPKKA